VEEVGGFYRKFLQWLLENVTTSFI